jgi:hypothetical protein
MPSVAYKQGKRAFDDATGMSNPYTPMITKRYDRRDGMQQALVRSESDWNKGHNDAKRSNESRIKQLRTDIKQLRKGQ